MNEHTKHSRGTIKKMAAKHRGRLKQKTAPLNDMIAKLSEVHRGGECPDSCDQCEWLAGEVEEGGDDEMLSGEKQLVRHVHEVIDTYNKLQVDPVELYSFCFTPLHTDAFPMFGRILNSHAPQCEISDIPPTVFTG